MGTEPWEVIASPHTVHGSHLAMARGPVGQKWAESPPPNPNLQGLPCTAQCSTGSRRQVGLSSGAGTSRHLNTLRATCATTNPLPRNSEVTHPSSPTSPDLPSRRVRCRLWGEKLLDHPAHRFPHAHPLNPTPNRFGLNPPRVLRADPSPPEALREPPGAGARPGREERGCGGAGSGRPGGCVLARR